nr:HAMP domain-containing protein [Solirubrobacterales bacterium]
SFADEVTRVAKEVGTEGKLGGQAEVKGVSGTWRDLTENVNFMASNLTTQVRTIAQVTTAVAEGDLSRKVTVEAQGEVAALTAARDGDFGVRLKARRHDVVGDIQARTNELLEMNTRMARELARVASVIGREGRVGERAAMPGVYGGWADAVASVNALVDDLVRPTNEVARVIEAVADGDLDQRMALEIEGQPVKGEFARIGQVVNAMVDQLSSFGAEVTRVAREVGTEGKLGGQAQVRGVSGTWKDLTDSVNYMASNLTEQVRQIAGVTTAVANGDLSQQITVDAQGEILELKRTVNAMVAQLSDFAAEVTRVSREVGTEGVLGGQADVRDVSGTWRDLTDSVNVMASNLTDQVRQIAAVTTAVAGGDLTQKVTVEAKGEVSALAKTINAMTDTLRRFADQVTGVAREVGTEGVLGGQADVPGVAGTWKDLTDSVNSMASNLTDQVRNIAQVTTAVARGDLTQQITVDARGEILELKDTINTMVDQLSSFAAEVTRVAREVGTEGELGGQARVEGVSGTWRDLTENVNSMAANLTEQVRNIAQVATAVARGDLTQQITVDARGEILELKDTINTMVDQLSSFAAEVTRVAREVGTEGELGGQAQVEDVSGTWRGLTENVNSMAANLTGQVRNIAQVTTAVAQGDLSQKITVDARGEIAELKDTINTMVDQLSSFAAEVTRVAKEVGTEGKLGGQAEVKGLSGTWRDLTENVNSMADNLTDQVRAIAEVSTAVTQGDLTQEITVQAQGEVAELKDNVNQMIDNLRETTRRNADQDWLNTNLARFSNLMQGERDLQTVSQLLMSQISPLVSAQHSAFFLVHEDGDGGECARELRLMASYGYQSRNSLPTRFAFGEGLPGQAALEGKSILVTSAPADYIKVVSGLGEASPVNLIVLPILFEDETLAVIELASLQEFSEVDLSFLEQLAETIGVVLTTIIANRRTEELLEESQRLTQELQSQQEALRRSNAELGEQAQSLKASEELLQTQQEELRQTNEELQEKAAQLSKQNRDIETKNAEIELARGAHEERAAQLSISSMYKSEFLANMSHELRTPLNSLLILSKLLADNVEGNLTDKQVEFARTITGAGSDLLGLISDILDLSKVEAGKMDVHLDRVELAGLLGDLDRSFRAVAEEVGLALRLELAAGLPEAIVTDEQRLHQVVRNLLSNALKFTASGEVAVELDLPPTGTPFAVAITVRDTGIGIASEKLALIFEAFQQADGTTSRRYGGTGLGLSISREIAALLGGEIRVDSVEDEGSAFTLLLPASTPAPAATPAPAPRAGLP